MATPSERRKKITLQAGQICPLCREKVHREEILNVCPGCRAVYHRDCSGELASGRCTTLGCRYSQRRTASGRTPTRPEPDQPHRPRRAPRTEAQKANSILRAAMAFGVTVAFLFLAAHFSSSIESHGSGAAQRKKKGQRKLQDARTLARIKSFRTHADYLRELTQRGPPPASWRFPSLKFQLGRDSEIVVPDTAVLGWEQLRAPTQSSPYDRFFPSGFRRGLWLSRLREDDSANPRYSGLPPESRTAARIRYVIALRVASFRPAVKVIEVNRLRVTTAAGETFPADKVREAGLWPTGAPLHMPARVVLHAYLYDLQEAPSYKGCLTISEPSPSGYRARAAQDASLASLLPERNLGSFDPMIAVDCAALAAAIRRLRVELDPALRR